MEKIKFFLITILSLITISGCKKDSVNTNKKVNVDFPKNTIWTGTFRPTSRQYDKPCGLKFNNDNTVTLYGLFYFLEKGEFLRKDSISGTINTIENKVEGTTVRIVLPDAKDTLSLLINNDKSLATGGTLNPNSPNFLTLNVELFTDDKVTLDGTFWSGPIMRDGPIEGMNAYPDLSAIQFKIIDNVKNTFYIRNGEPAKMSVPQSGNFYTIQSVYQNSGPLVWMNGYDESANKLIYYFGVIAASGDKMFVDAKTSDARLPNYLQTIAWYGPQGMTPTIYKQ